MTSTSYTRVSDKLQASGTTVNNFTDPLTYVVYAENRDITKNWKVNVTVARNSAADFFSFEVPCYTRSVTIDKEKKSIQLDIFENCYSGNLTVKFELSSGARAWLGDVEQYSEAGTVDLTGTLEYRIVAEDGVTSATWKVSAVGSALSVRENRMSLAGLSVYPNPSDGVVKMEFSNIRDAGLIIDKKNIHGEKVYSFKIDGTGDFTVEKDLTSLSAGFYIVNCTEFERPVILIIEK